MFASTNLRLILSYIPPYTTAQECQIIYDIMKKKYQLTLTVKNTQSLSQNQQGNSLRFEKDSKF